MSGDRTASAPSAWRLFSAGSERSLGCRQSWTVPARPRAHSGCKSAMVRPVVARCHQWPCLFREKANGFDVVFAYGCNEMTPILPAHGTGRRPRAVSRRFGLYL
jgi:hypothetical protein